MFTVIAFDIVDDRTRYRVVQVLRRYAVRVQKSVFEAGKLNPADFHRMRLDVERLINVGEDTVRYYLLCGNCVPRIEVSGLGRLTKAEEYKVV
ncbi:MAG: CRISPR-associated endonuclease Cas2 [Deltaproteobacteria bacterium]|nr:CRISPR-associated endonuclease Cas2 [Deltaproteobacteria bacterium]